MAVKELIKDPDLLVESKAWKVLGNNDLVYNLLNDLEDTLNSMPDRLFLCSNEIGYKERAIMVKFKDDMHLFINPAFQNRNKAIINRELSLDDGKEYFIPRFTEVDLVFQDEVGKVLAFKMSDVASVVMCQAMDALNGIYASDYGLPILEGFDDLSDDDKSTIISDYINKMNEDYDKLDKELSDDSETKTTWGAAKFIRGVADGTVQTEEVEMSNRQKKKINKLAKQAKEMAKKMRFWGKK